MEECTHVVAVEVVDSGLGEHAVVLELRLAERRGVASNDDELGLSAAERLEGGLVAEDDWWKVLVCGLIVYFSAPTNPFHSS